MAWNRKKIIDFCVADVFTQVDSIAWYGTKNELMEVVQMVAEFRRKNNYPETMTAKVDDGFLYINNKPVGRIARKLNNPSWMTEGADYWEGRILARQETIYE